ncbi:MAG: hypothetical protein QXH92_03880 [Candidatus Aenigmatarchaeota archaeon]
MFKLTLKREGETVRIINESKFSSFDTVASEETCIVSFLLIDTLLHLFGIERPEYLLYSQNLIDLFELKQNNGSLYFKIELRTAKGESKQLESVSKLSLKNILPVRMLLSAFEIAAFDSCCHNSHDGFDVFLRLRRTVMTYA